jgi:hypothetical protein
MAKLNLLFGIHCHHPLGSPEQSFESAYNENYLPLIETLARHPRAKFAAYFSGTLYDWFVEKHPEFIDFLDKLARRGQIEMLSGGFYDPILTIIPDEDKLGQIEMANQFIKEKFGRAPHGMWLTESVWEPALPRIFSRAEIEFVLLDEDLFIQAGINTLNLYGYHLTDDEGEMVKVFPVNRTLRDYIFSKTPEEVLEYLRLIHAQNQNAAVVFMEDAAKFGTQENIHYLEDLLSRLMKSDWIKFNSFASYLDEYPPIGQIYIPCGSHFEMMQWSRAASSDEEKQKGYFKNFFIKYPEANNLHKKMLYVSNKLRSMNKGKTLINGHLPKKELVKARKELYKAQNNAAYWHGESGGIHLGHLRQATYSHLISSEMELEKFKRGDNSFVELAVTDFDKDGQDEVILSNKFLNCCFSPRRGGSLFELDYKPKPFNLINTFARRREKYHEDNFISDRYPRFCLIDHFLRDDADLEKFSASNYVEDAGFCDGQYSFIPKRSGLEAGIRLSRQALVQGKLVKVEKYVSLLANQSLFVIEYEVANLSGQDQDLRFGVEFNLNLVKDSSLQSRGEIPQVRNLKIIDEKMGFDVSLEFDKPALCWRYPIETFSRTEKGIFKINQGVTIFPNWKLKLLPKALWTVKISFRIEE